MGKFTNQVNKFARKYESRLRAVARTAVQDTVSIAQRTRPEGGRMRIDTGFLRASIQAALHSMPSGPTKNEGNRTYPVGSVVAGAPISVTLLRWDPNKEQKLFVGWTSNYAAIRESKDGFMRGAVEQWDQTVKKAVRKVESGFG